MNTEPDRLTPAGGCLAVVIVAVVLAVNTVLVLAAWTLLD